jgi:hypothetical protein
MLTGNSGNPLRVTGYRKHHLSVERQRVPMLRFFSFAELFFKFVVAAKEPCPSDFPQKWRLQQKVQQAEPLDMPVEALTASNFHRVRMRSHVWILKPFQSPDELPLRFSRCG